MRIQATNEIRDELKALANDYHMHHDKSKAEVVLLYRVYHNEPAYTEWVLVRFKNEVGASMSAMHMVCGSGSKEYLSEYFSCTRKHEAIMLANWTGFVEGEDYGECCAAD